MSWAGNKNMMNIMLPLEIIQDIIPVISTWVANIRANQSLVSASLRMQINKSTPACTQNTQNSLCKAMFLDQVVTVKLKASLVKSNSAEDPSPGQSTVIKKDMRTDVTACMCIHLSHDLKHLKIYSPNYHLVFSQVCCTDLLLFFCIFLWKVKHTMQTE